MGQYYYGVILNRETRKPMMACYCGKLGETVRTDDIYYELSKYGNAYKQRVVWAGDYSERKDYDGQPLYNVVADMKDAGTLPSTLPQIDAYAKEHGEKWTDVYDRFVAEHHLYREDGLIADDFRYLCDHDKREVVDIQAYKNIGKGWDYQNFGLLPCLTSDPTCRILGGGDYCYRESFEDVGRWSGDILSVEPEIPQGYKLIKPYFAAKTRIVDYFTIEEILFGKNAKQKHYYPNTTDFISKYIYHDKDWMQHALADNITVCKDYWHWCQSLQWERVYGAYDKAKDIIKADPKLKREHGGVTVDLKKERLIIDGVSIDIDKNEQTGRWSLNMLHFAELDGIDYDNSAAARRYFRTLLKNKAA